MDAAEKEQRKAERLAAAQIVLIQYLSDGAWHTWRDIKRDTGIRRESVRCMEVYNNGRLIGNAQDGIKLAAKADDDEIEHTLRAMRSHAAEILLRADAIEAQYWSI